MSPSNDFAPKVTLLDGTNYPLWAFMMKMYLISKGLWEAINATSGVSEAKKQQALASIVLNLSDTQIMHVITTDSAREAWGALARVHRTQDMANRLRLIERFATFKYTATDMSTHIMEQERLVLQMNGAMCGPSFSQERPQFSFKDLVSKLIAEEGRKKDTSRIEDETAYAGKRQQKNATTKEAVVTKRKGPVFSAAVVVSADITHATTGNRNMIEARGKKFT
uniref:DUF4219 domain-containing protein n=1 Tax=Peronospora matthiolae TaxID=2874970 RepID=A0AAV1TZW8_9STRA